MCKLKTHLNWSTTEQHTKLNGHLSLLILWAVSQVAPLFIYFNPAAAPELSVHLRSHDPFPIDMEASCNKSSFREGADCNRAGFNFSQTTSDPFLFINLLAVSQLISLFIYFNHATARERSLCRWTHDPFPINMEQVATNSFIAKVNIKNISSSS